MSSEDGVEVNDVVRPPGMQRNEQVVSDHGDRVAEEDEKNSNIGNC